MLTASSPMTAISGELDSAIDDTPALSRGGIAVTSVLAERSRAPHADEGEVDRDHDRVQARASQLCSAH